jgi:hypothetical protein
MALIEHTRTHARHALMANHLVGRAPGCELCVETPYTSSEHAAFQWRDGVWTVRDLGSRNGTFVNGRKLGPSERVALALGQEIAFGLVEDVWKVVDVAAPGLAAECVQTGVLVHAVGKMLALPGPAQPDVTLLEAPDGTWCIERDSAVEPVANLAVISVGDQDWRLYLPVSVGLTVDTRSPTLKSVADLRLRFRVSLDEEHIELIARAGDETFVLGARTFNCVLLALARARLEDRREGRVAELAQGWMRKEEVLKEAGVDESLLNLHVFNARQEFAHLGVSDPVQIVDRSRKGKLRLGVAEVEEEKI